MSDEQLAANVRAVLDAVERKIGEGSGSIGTIRIKTTMGKPVNLGALK